MYKIYLSPQAIFDLELIFDYTVENWSFNTAQKYQDELFFRFKLASKNPEIGQPYLHKTGNYRKLKSGRHLIFYRPNDKEGRIEIVRILHEKMDLKSQFE